MARPEALFCKDERGNPYNGRLIAAVSSRKIKGKWAERLAIMANPDRVRKVPDTYEHYGLLRLTFPGAPTWTQNYRGGQRTLCILTNAEYHYFHQVVVGEVDSRVWNVLAQAWSSTIYQLFRQAEKDKAVEQFFDEEVEPLAGLRGGLGRDMRGDVDLLDTWCWGSGDKTLGFATNVSGWEESDYEQVTGDEYLNFGVLPGMSQASKAQAQDPSLVFEPRRNKHVPRQAVYVVQGTS